MVPFFELAEIITFSATVADGEDQPSNINVVWSSDIDGEIQNVPANRKVFPSFPSMV